MTLQQLKIEIRNAYEWRDREALERSLALLDQHVRAGAVAAGRQQPEAAAPVVQCGVAGIARCACMPSTAR